MESLKRVVVNFAKGSWYPKGQKRLVRSFLSAGYDGDFMLAKDESEIGCPQHKEVPYAFKAYMLRQAVEEGYEQIFWCDSAIVLVGHLNRLYEQLSSTGYLFAYGGWNNGQWCSDAALVSLDITREEAFDTPHMMANMMGFDMRHDVCHEFLKQYYEKATDGVSFKGAWRNRNHEVSNDDRVLGHRHDQTAASVIAHKLGMTDWLVDWTEYNTITTNPKIMFLTYPELV